MLIGSWLYMKVKILIGVFEFQNGEKQATVL